MAKREGHVRFEWIQLYLVDISMRDFDTSCTVDPHASSYAVANQKRNNANVTVTRTVVLTES